MKKSRRKPKAKNLINVKDFKNPVSMLSTIVILGTAAWAFILILSMLFNAQ